jgi:phage terminase large subunit-like protein
MSRTTRASINDHPAEIYAQEAASGRLVCSKWVRLAAQRHLRDREEGAKRGLYFDPRAAQHVIDFYGFLRHSKGEWAGQPLVLEPWQQFILWVLFGWKRSDGTRRFREAYVELGRKNGKSTKAAGIGLYLLCADGEPGAEVYCAATKKDQARIVFTEAERMRKASPWLAKRIKKFRDNMNIEGTASKFEPLGSDEDTLDGLNPHGAIVDELHAHKTRAVLDVLTTAMGSRRQPLLFEITTAGFNKESVCWKQHEYAEKVLEGINGDDSFFGFIATLDEGDDWEDEKNWPKANPNLGVSVKLDDLRRLANKAKQDPASLNSFLRLRLNVWTQQDTRWMPMDKWNLCVGHSLKLRDAKVLRAEVEQQLAGRMCYAGLDLSSKIDLTALVFLFPPTEDDALWTILPYFYMPENNVARRVKEDRVQYDVWIREGFITATEGNVVDYEIVEDEVLRARKRFDLRELAFDSWNAQATANRLAKDDVLMVEFGQGYKSMSEPTKEVMKLVLEKKLAHLANPVLRWNMSNIVIKSDEAGNLKPNKDKSSEKIDGAVALIMALGRAIAHPSEDSVYTSDRGVFTV